MTGEKFQVGEWLMLSQRQRMSPFPNYMSQVAMCNNLKEHVGVNLSEVLFFFQGNIFFAFQKSDSFNKAGEQIIKSILKNPNLYAELTEKEEKYGPDLVAFAKTSRESVNAETSPEDLYEMFATYEAKYRDAYATYGSVWVIEDKLNAMLFEIIEKRIMGDPTKASDILNALTKQPSAMVTTIERKALLNIATEVADNKVWEDLIKAGDVDAIRKQKDLFKKIDRHLHNYFWITRDYEDPILTPESVVERLGEYLSEGAQQLLKELHDKLDVSEKKRTEYLEELKLTEEELGLFNAMREAAHIKELRKRYVSESLYYFDTVLEEIAKRLYLSIKQVRFFRTEDVKASLLDGVDMTEDANARMKVSAWYMQEGKLAEVTVGEEANNMFDEFCGVDENATEFTGMPVSPGKAQGPVKIVMNPDECDKVEEGDIIVTVQTVPSFSTAIIKAGGMICDGGHGITSHPATLSREAGIPCIIQTRFAREVLKDGDIVEVDGYKGIARLIQKRA